MKNGAKYSRRNFLSLIFWASIFLPFLQYCERKGKSLLLKITGTNHVLGHQLWAKDFPAFSEVITTKYLIVGGGVTGLTAARYFAQNDEEDFLVMELEKNLGGNSSNGENKFSKFPLGAHYLPIPNKEDLDLIQFLKECKMYLGDDENGLPILDDYQLTFPNQERLFFKNAWQNNLVPQKGISEESKTQFLQFFSMMEEFKNKKDQNGKYWFDIPLSRSSTESYWYDGFTFKKWLDEQNFTAKELLWHLDYCCKDDYGLGIDFISAWAGIHYFSGRKNNWAPNRNDQVFTWPEGNARLIKHLSVFSKKKSITNQLIFDIKINDQVEVFAYDAEKKITKKIIAQKVLLATPQFVNSHIMKNRPLGNFEYVPWLLATLTLKNEFGGDAELAWDNVIFGAEGLGYIYDQHQNISQNLNEKVITYYRSFNSDNSKKARGILFRNNEEELKKMVLDDLKIAHPLIEDYLLEIQFHKLGHAMIAPIPNHLFGSETKKAKESIDQKVFFAHTDLVGISIFEEAFHQGNSVAKEMI